MTSAPLTARPLVGGLRWLLVVETGVVFLAGIPLFLGSDQTDQYFAWTIKPPLTAAFLGALYWASVPLVLLSSRERLWARARIAVPAVLVFTALGLLATLLHLDRFHLSSTILVARGVAWAWLAIYVLVPPITLTLLVGQLRRPGADPPRQAPLPQWMRALLAMQAAVMLAFGVALFLMPEATSPLWPWALTPLTAPAVAAWLVGLAVW